MKIMQVFELHFNPKNKEDKVFDSFVYEPENIYEKKLGNLYMAGELTKFLPQNSRFLNSLALTIKKEYYGTGLKKSPEMSLQDALKRGNEFLDNEVKRGNVSWLGNLNFAILNFSSQDFLLNFTKAGNIKILLIRDSELLDISQNLELQEAAPFPLKVFENTASGRLTQDDKIIILTQDVFSALSQDGDFLTQLGEISDEKGLKEILKTKKQILSEVSGICFLLMIGQESEGKQTLTFRNKSPKFSFRETFFKPVLQFKNPLFKIKFKTPSFKTPSFKFFKLPSFKIPSLKPPVSKAPPQKTIAPKTSPLKTITSFKFPKIKIPKIKLTLPKNPNLYKRGGLVVIFVLILTASFFGFRGEREKVIKEAQQIIIETQSKIMMAENFLILKDEEKANTLFKEAREIILPLAEVGMPLRKEALRLQQSIEERLR